MENTLSVISLRSLLSDIVPGIEVVCYPSLQSYEESQPQFTAHFFVSESEAFRNPEFFKQVMSRTIVIISGAGSSFVQSGFRVIDATQSEQHIVRSLMQIHSMGHPQGHPIAIQSNELAGSATAPPQLSAREKDVLALIVKGYINKEIADRLNISIATVIFHRNNISEKLNTRSIGRLTVYAVLNNIVALAEL
jgi:DNA-binding CsgD family transcriptional regulator